VDVRGRASGGGGENRIGNTTRVGSAMERDQRRGVEGKRGKEMRIRGLSMGSEV
jgi:hypothetical protein